MKSPIWFANPTLEAINRRGAGTMIEHLGIIFTSITDDSLKARMPVDQRTKQPAGLLHGGASAALAETIASTAGNLVVDSSRQICVGLEINANHLRSCTEGMVEGEARPLHLGGSTQVWEIRITQEARLVCVSRLTLAVLDRRANAAFRGDAGRGASSKP